MSRPLNNPRRKGISLVEAVMATVLVSLVLVSSMQMTGGIARSGRTVGERALAGEIADGLVEEILAKPYYDTVTPSVLGRDAGETSSSKANYDDVDDYHGWTQSILYTGRSSTADGLVATVTVSWATLATPNVDAVTDTGLKHIRVTVTRQSRVLAVRDAWKASAL